MPKRYMNYSSVFHLHYSQVNHSRQKASINDVHQPRLTATSFDRKRRKKAELGYFT